MFLEGDPDMIPEDVPCVPAYSADDWPVDPAEYFRGLIRDNQQLKNTAERNKVLERQNEALTKERDALRAQVQEDANFRKLVDVGAVQENFDVDSPSSWGLFTQNLQGRACSLALESALDFRTLLCWTRDDFLELKGVGSKTVRDIEEALSALGMTIGANCGMQRQWSFRRVGRRYVCPVSSSCRVEAIHRHRDSLPGASVWCGYGTLRRVHPLLGGYSLPEPPLLGD